jgi:hypothetical protein
MINKFREELELPPQKSYHMDAAPMLCFYSPQVPSSLSIYTTRHTTLKSVICCRWLREHRTGLSS